MPQEPKKRHSRQRQGKRRAHISYSVPQAINCPNCQALTVPHIVCKSCGYYDGKQVITINKTIVRKAQTNENRP